MTAAQAIGLPASASVESDLVAAATEALAAQQRVALVALTPFELVTLVELAHASRASAQPLVIALPIPHARRALVLDVAGDLGITAVSELQPLMAALARTLAGAALSFPAMDMAMVILALMASAAWALIAGVAAGNLLDGDGSGSAGGDWVRDFCVVPAKVKVWLPGLATKNRPLVTEVQAVLLVEKVPSGFGGG